MGFSDRQRQFGQVRMAGKVFLAFSKGAVKMCVLVCLCVYVVFMIMLLHMLHISFLICYVVVVVAA